MVTEWALDLISVHMVCKESWRRYDLDSCERACIEKSDAAFSRGFLSSSKGNEKTNPPTVTVSCAF